MAAHKYAPLDGGADPPPRRRKNLLLAIFALLAFFAITYNLFWPASDEQIRIECRKKIGPRKVHVILPASGTSPRFCRSLSTLLIHNYEPTIINWGGDSHHSSKIFKVLEYLENHTSAIAEKQLETPPQCEDERGDIVISVDAYDVFAQRPLETVLSTFDSIPEKIVYSAEKGCHPPGEEWCSQISQGPLPSNFYGPGTDNLGYLEHSRARFLNSGFVIGYAKDLHTLYTEASSDAIARKGQFDADQSIFGPLFTSHRHNLKLDYYGSMATPTFFFELELGFKPTPIELQAPDPRFISDEIMWNQFNQVTNQFPTFIHYNGPKEWMDREWTKTWWGGGQGQLVMDRINSFLTSNASVGLDNGASLAFRDICPGSWQIP